MDPIKSAQRTLALLDLHILDAGHFALDEKTEEVARLTREFMARVDHGP